MVPPTTPPSPPEHKALSDPRSLKALAHPARYDVITWLYDGEVLTASQAASRTGLTPSAMSYHLRLLERWGIAERVGDSTDARERPWRAVARRLRFEPDVAAPSAMTDVRVAATALLRDLSQTVEAMFSAPRKGDRAPGAMVRSALRLDSSQASALLAELDELLVRYEALDTDNPPNTPAWDLFWVTLPRP